MALSDMTDDDVNTMFRPKLDALGVLHALSLRTACAAVRIVLVDLRSARFAVACPLHGDQYLPRHLRLCPPRPGLPATVVNWGLWKSLADMQSDAAG